VVSFKLALNNPTLPEITDGYETKLHHAPGHDLTEWPVQYFEERTGKRKPKMSFGKG
jgi:hypothetical protein